MGESAMSIYNPKKILVPIDLSELSEGVLQAALDIQRKWDADLTALHVADESDHLKDYLHGYSRNLPFYDIKEQTQKRLEVELQKLTVRLSPNSGVRQAVTWGDPFREILRISEEEDFDLIVMGNHSRTGLNRFFMGSVSEQVIRRAPCPVLIVRKKVPRERLVQPKIIHEVMN
jgi:universal stress protein A